MKILIAEDDRVFRRKLEKMLDDWEYDVTTCSNGLEAWEKIQTENGVNLIILDWMMPGIDGVELCRKIRNLEKEPYTYILLLTVKDKKEDLVEGMDAGADDYITKPFSPHELEVRLRAGKRVVQLQEELMTARDSFQVKATLDSLTGILNRGTIINILKKELERSSREKHNVSVILLDIDHFKSINDNLGHLVGDKVLCETVKRLRSKMRSYDSIGRYGGEEFLIVLPGCDSDNALTQAERLRTCICEKPVDISGNTINITSSFGVRTLEIEEKIDIESLVLGADKALYRAKDKGRNRVEVTVAKK